MNLDPDVRTHLWLRASGAAQYVDSNEGYEIEGTGRQQQWDYYTALQNSPIYPNNSISTIRADQDRIKFDLEVTKQRDNIKMLELGRNVTTKSMQKRFAEVMINYTKRNGAFVYNQSQSEIMVRILEVVHNEKIAFWIYSCLLETILPLNFFTSTLYPQAFLNYTIELMNENDNKYFEEVGDAINMFCLKSYYSLFCNLEVIHSTNQPSERG